MVQCHRGGGGGVDGVVAAGQGGVEGVGDVDGDSVVDFPEGADYVGVASELERGGQVNGFVDQLGSGTKCGAAGRQVGQPGVVEPDRGQAGNG